MKFRIFDDKKMDGESIDLLSNIWQIDYSKVLIIDWIRVDSTTEMALDLIALTVYGDQDRMDVLKKFNKIDNALELYTGQIIACPDLTSFNDHLRKIEIKPIQLQKQKVLKRNFDTSTSINLPSSRSEKGQAQIRKGKDGVLIF